MTESTITTKGQTTVPAEIRTRLNATPGTRLVWSMTPDGTILVRAKSRSLADLAGSLKPAAGKHLDIGDMDPWR